MLKALAILSDATVRRSAVNPEVETILEIKQKATVLEVIKKPIFTSFPKTLLTTKRRLTGW